MKSSTSFLMIAVFIITGMGTVFAAEKAPQAVIDYTNTELVKWGTDPVIVKAVNEENAKNKTLDQIKELDKKWMATAGVADFMKAFMDNECGKHLQDLKKATQFLVEAFVMDNQGALVAETDKTSDYWQGDEDKFTKSFNGGKGGIDIGDIKFDDSTQIYEAQVSVPVKDGDKVIGAITIGVDVDKFKK